jgi:hypothetical protein
MSLFQVSFGWFLGHADIMARKVDAHQPLMSAARWLSVLLPRAPRSTP